MKEQTKKVLLSSLWFVIGFLALLWGVDKGVAYILGSLWGHFMWGGFDK